MNKIDSFFDITADQKISKVLVIDFMNLVFRTLNSSQHANPLDVDFALWKRSLITTMFSYIMKFDPDRVVVALDVKDSWRKGLYPQYKGQRKDARDASIIDYEKFFKLYPSFESDMRKVFKSLAFITAPTAEADDIIAVLAKKFEKTNTQLICVSNDGDLNQLLKYKNYSQYNPIKKTMVEVLSKSIIWQIGRA